MRFIFLASTLILLSPYSTAAADTPPDAAPDTQDALDTWILPPTTRTYQAVDAYPAAATTEYIEVTEAWTQADPNAYRVTTTERQADLPDAVSSLVFHIDARGWSYSENLLRDGTLLSFNPPKYVLHLPAPSNTSWSAIHPSAKGDSVTRTCTQRAGAAFCANGVTVTCLSAKPAQDIFIREHYCPQQGWRGSEAAIYKDGLLIMGSRTARVRTNDTTYPDPPDSDRPYPSALDVLSPDTP